MDFMYPIQKWLAKIGLQLIPIVEICLKRNRIKLSFGKHKQYLLCYYKQTVVFPQAFYDIIKAGQAKSIQKLFVLLLSTADNITNARLRVDSMCYYTLYTSLIPL